MARLVISLPDDLLRAIDAEAGRRGTTRSGLLRDLAEHSLRSLSHRRSARMAEIDHDGEAIGHGGDVAGVLRRSRRLR